MKFFNWLGTILIILIIIAAITAPSDKKFENFISKDKGGDTMSCKPVIGKTTYAKVLVKIFSIHYVSYCELSSTPVQIRIQGKKTSGSDTANAVKLTVPKITSSETYLGLFGRFWKI